MAKKIILGTDIARDAFKTKVNDNFTELYDKDVALGEQISDLDANKANKAQSNWVSVNLNNGWTGTLEVAKNDLDIVTIRWYLTAGIITEFTNVATLLGGVYVPSQRTYLPSLISSKTGIPFYIDTDGQIKITPTSGLVASASCRGLLTYYAN